MYLSLYEIDGEGNCFLLDAFAATTIVPDSHSTFRLPLLLSFSTVRQSESRKSRHCRALIGSTVGNGSGNGLVTILLGSKAFLRSHKALFSINI